MKKLDVLVDADWLRRKTEADPDLDCEAGGTVAVKELLEQADQYRHPDFDSDCEKLVVQLADALKAARCEATREPRTAAGSLD